MNQIAGYDIIRKLGTGAGSELYAARDKRGGLFCLKHVVKKNPKDQRFLDQAIMEHQIAKKFDHTSLRKSYRVIKQREILRVSEIAVIMELVEGATLEHHKLPSIAKLIELFGIIASGLQTMHREGYVHADIKPNNIMITREGHVKLIDFGQSCPIGTIKERIQGTPDYIAPEQVKRQAITEQTDVFNLGATLYWLLTSERVPTIMPKKGTAEAIRRKERELVKPQTPQELNSAVPPALSALIMECVETDPRQRPKRMTEVCERLELASKQANRDGRPGTGTGVSPAPGKPTNPGSTVDVPNPLHDTAELTAPER